jgi:hypothetical protein
MRDFLQGRRIRIACNEQTSPGTIAAPKKICMAKPAKGKIIERQPKLDRT